MGRHVWLHLQSGLHSAIPQQFMAHGSLSNTSAVHSSLSSSQLTQQYLTFTFFHTAAVLQRRPLGEIGQGKLMCGYNTNKCGYNTNKCGYNTNMCGCNTKVNFASVQYSMMRYYSHLFVYLCICVFVYLCICIFVYIFVYGLGRLGKLNASQLALY